jgi:hypothetical protein
MDVFVLFALLPEQNSALARVCESIAYQGMTSPNVCEGNFETIPLGRFDMWAGAIRLVVRPSAARLACFRGSEQG